MSVDRVTAAVTFTATNIFMTVTACGINNYSGMDTISIGSTSATTNTIRRTTTTAVRTTITATT